VVVGCIVVSKTHVIPICCVVIGAPTADRRTILPVRGRFGNREVCTSPKKFQNLEL
jgi:hypothetical protein